MLVYIFNKLIIGLFKFDELLNMNLEEMNKEDLAQFYLVTKLNGFLAHFPANGAVRMFNQSYKQLGINNKMAEYIRNCLIKKSK